MSDKIYVGSGKEVFFNDGNSIVSVSIDLEALYAASKAGHGFQSKNTGKKYIKLNLSTRRETGKFGETHSLTVDTWKPDPNRQSNGSNGGSNGWNGQQNATQQGAPPPSFEDDIPF
jgi:hypothetical protein